MLFLVLRIIIGPLGVLVGTIAQRRLGHAVGGLVIGLPLTSLPLLGLVALQRGSAFTGSMTTAILIGSIAEGLVLWTYAHMTTRFSPVIALTGTLALFTISLVLLGTLHLSAITAGVLTAAGFALALRWWPTTNADESVPSGRSRLAARVVAATIFTVIIVTMAGKLGALLSGLVDALPMTTMLMAFMTHQEQGSEAASRFVRGVLRGSFSWVISTVVLAELLRTGDLMLAFGLSLATALVVQGAIQAADSLPIRKRALSYP
ncbi:MAG: hypothetical protein WCA31_03940 [Acidimicrobiales bacterium]